MEYNITIFYDSNTYITKAKEGENLLDVIINHDINIDAPCGGNGTCGKCRVKIIGDIEKPTPKEKQLLGEHAKEGYRLACYHEIEKDITVVVEKSDSEAEIMTKGVEFDIESKPIIKKQVVTLDESTLEDQRSLLKKILDKTKLVHEKLDVSLLNHLNRISDNNNCCFTCVYEDKNLLGIEEGDTSNFNYAIATDIGTTTVACYLVDVKSGDEIDVESFLNPQKRFGADVISRIDYLMENKNIETIQKPIITRINKAISNLVKRNNISRNQIYSAFFVGNTTMIHFLLGLNPEKIAKAPFIPLTNYAHKIESTKLGIDISNLGYVYNLPMVASYIGADTTAAVLSSRMAESKDISLLMDLGTNGEIVLGNNEFLSSCSAAAGPAFEGANIRNGVAGIEGAIDNIELKDGNVEIETIGDKKPIGICGSAIIDIIAKLLDIGIVDETGRIIDKEEAKEKNIDSKYLDRVIRVDDLDSFLLVEEKDAAIKDKIVITQKDIREVQNAKAAIAAGVRILIEQSKIDIDDIQRVFLAGGFGSYINIHNAATIGLIPAKLENKVLSIGNAAGTGAILSSISTDEYEEVKIISEKIKYYELSSNAEFTNAYVEEMIFGEE